jgi:protein-tyrosine phosphatase
LELARALLDDGVTTVAATPHGLENHHVVRYSVPLLRERLAELHAALAAESLPLEVIPGTELYCAADLPARLRAGERLPYGTSRAVLVEFPLNVLPNTLEQTVFALQSAGYRVLVAHPERYRVVQHEPELLAPFIERGVLMQLTAEALLGGQGEVMQELSEVLVSQRLIQVIASDAHGSHQGRMPCLSAARVRAAELTDEAEAWAMVRDTPAALLSDGPLHVLPPQLGGPSRRHYRRGKRWWMP